MHETVARALFQKCKEELMGSRTFLEEVGDMCRHQLSRDFGFTKSLPKTAWMGVFLEDEVGKTH